MGVVEATIGAITGQQAANTAADASQRGTELSIAAIQQAMQMQIAEIQRQYNDQRQLLTPMLQRQYDANTALSDLLGISGMGPPVPGVPEAQQPPVGNTGPATGQPYSIADQLNPPGEPQATAPPEPEFRSPWEQYFGGGDGGGSDSPSDIPPEVLRMAGGAAPPGAFGGPGAEGQFGTTASAMMVAPDDPRLVGPPESIQAALGGGGAAPPSDPYGMAGQIVSENSEFYGQAPQEAPRQVPPEVRENILAALGGGGAAPVLNSLGLPVGGGSGGRLQDLSTQGSLQSGAFYDSNLDNRQFGADQWENSDLGRLATDRRVAGLTAGDDIAVQRAAETGLFAGVENDSLVQRVEGNALAGASMADDAIYQDMLSRQRLGDSFEASPGYQFAQEEAQRAVERSNSIGGGNLSGAAIDEAMRRSQGVAQQEYYNWLGARMQEDQRLDSAANAFAGRRQYDLARGDAAVMDARRREELDLARGDQALYNYLARNQAQIGREDAAAASNLQQQRIDQQMQQQNYLNRISQLSAAAGVGSNAVGQAVNAAGVTGQALAGIYGQGGYTQGQLQGQNALTQGALQAGAIANAGQQYQQGSTWLLDSGAGGGILGLLL